MKAASALLVALAPCLSPPAARAWAPAPLSLASGLPLRRSVARFESDPVPQETINAAIEAALLAPNHFLSEPTRFYQLGPTVVDELKGLNPDKAKMFDGVPGWMLVTIRTEHLDDGGGLSSKLALEDHATVSCAIQNFMQSLAEDGVGTKWMTGALGIDPEDVCRAAGVGEGELMVGVVWYGVPGKPLADLKAPKRKLGVEDVLTTVGYKKKPFWERWG